MSASKKSSSSSSSTSNTSTTNYSDSSLNAGGANSTVLGAGASLSINSVDDRVATAAFAGAAGLADSSARLAESAIDTVAESSASLARAVSADSTGLAADVVGTNAALSNAAINTVADTASDLAGKNASLAGNAMSANAELVAGFGDIVGKLTQASIDQSRDASERAVSLSKNLAELAVGNVAESKTGELTQVLPKLAGYGVAAVGLLALVFVVTRKK